MTQETHETVLINAVNAGAAILDSYAPGWHMDVNLNTLDQRSYRNCVLAQVTQARNWGTYYNPGLEHLNIATHDAWKYGFDSSFNSAVSSGVRVVNSEFDPIWRDLISSRQTAASTATVPAQEKSVTITSTDGSISLTAEEHAALNLATLTFNGSTVTGTPAALIQILKDNA